MKITYIHEEFCFKKVHYCFPNYANRAHTNNMRQYVYIYM